MAVVQAVAKLDSKPFNGNVKGMESRVKRFSNSVRMVKGLLLGAFGYAVIRNIQRLGMAAVKTASMFEDLGLQFKVILQDGLAAKRLFRELVEFSAVTPFSIEELSKGSQQLLNLTEGVYGGVESMRLFGDAIAATNRDVEGSTYWIGRLYAALQSGGEITRAVNALLRIKLLQPTVLRQMKEMKDAGASNAEIWKVFLDSLKRFEGGMEEMSQTVSGKMSTMKDNWRIAFAQMGEDFSSFTIIVLDGLTKIARTMATAMGVTSVYADAVKYKLKYSVSFQAAVGAILLKRMRKIKAIKEAGDGQVDGTGLEDGGPEKSLSRLPKIAVDKLQRAGGFTARVPGRPQRDRMAELVRSAEMREQHLSNIDRNTREGGVGE